MTILDPILLVHFKIKNENREIKRKGTCLLDLEVAVLEKMW